MVCLMLSSLLLVIKTSRLDIRTLHNSVLSFIGDKLTNEIVLSNDFKWNLGLIKKMYKKKI